MTHILDNYRGTEALVRAKRVPKNVLRLLFGMVEVPDALIARSSIPEISASSCNCNCGGEENVPMADGLGEVIDE